MAQYNAYSRRALGFAVQKRWKVGVAKAPRGVLRAPAMQLAAEPARPNLAAQVAHRRARALPSAAAGRGASASRGHVRSRSRQAAARRRQVFSVLGAGLGLSLSMGLVTGSAVAWWCFVALLALACSYLALLAWARKLEAEREFNLAFLLGARLPQADELFAGLSCLRPLDVRGPAGGQKGGLLGGPLAAPAPVSVGRRAAS